MNKLRTRSITRMGFGVTIVGLTLASCTVQLWHPNGAYGVVTENEILSSCELRASRDARNCVLGWLEAHVSATQLQQDGRAMYRGGSAPTYMATAAADCRGL